MKVPLNNLADLLDCQREIKRVKAKGDGECCRFKGKMLV